VAVAHTIEDKRQILTEARDSDDLLALRQVQYPTRQEVMVIDDREAPRQALLAAA
jgi:hypothetical protein